MQNSVYKGRRAASIENNHLRVTVLKEGGHIAEVYVKDVDVNPLWTPPWPTLEPSQYSASTHAIYGDGSDARLLAGIMGHNICLDLFGGPSSEEAAKGITAHGEGAVVPYELTGESGVILARAKLRVARLDFERQLTLDGEEIAVRELIVNRADQDRTIGWTQHVTLGPPFLEPGETQFRASASRSKVFEKAFGIADYLKPGAEFDWPIAPRIIGAVTDLRTFNGASTSSAYTAHLMDPQRPDAFFVAFAPAYNLAFGYTWNQADFPWMGIWEENRSRIHSPWSGRTIARGMEFGVSPFPESREEMMARGEMFGVPTCRRIPAGGRLRAEYRIVTKRTTAIPETI